MVHLSDLDWQLSAGGGGRQYKKGDVVKAVVLDVDVEKERISLGIKQLTEDPFQEAISGLKRGARVTCTVSRGHLGRASRSRPPTARPASSARPSCRASAASSGRTASRSARRSTPR